MIRLDDLENGYFIYQDTDAFCFGIDAVLLAHFGKLKNNDRVLDLCTGNGIVPLLMHADEIITRKAPVDIPWEQMTFTV